MVKDDVIEFVLEDTKFLNIRKSLEEFGIVKHFECTTSLVQTDTCRRDGIRLAFVYPSGQSRKERLGL
jgi:hypothetical protein